MLGFFSVISCTIDDRRDLQKCKNDALRICTGVRLTGHIRVEDLHSRCKLLSLEQRRRNQLLQLMYKKSKNM